MLKLDPASKTLVPVSATTLKQANILERQHLQEAILRSWDAYCGELGYEELFLVGSEIVPHDSCQNRIDILALSRDGTPVVFELKRHRDRLQLLQAISYAAMVARWDVARFLRELGGKTDEQSEELRSLLENEGFELRSPEIVVVAESFDPEVILAADWLGEFGVPITAFAVSAVEHGGETLISLDQKFPLPGLDEVYVGRAKVRDPSPQTSWDDALRNVTFSFAQKALETFRKRTDGSPQRRQFDSIYAGSPLGRMRIAFKRNYLKIYVDDQSPEEEGVLNERLGGVIPFKRWGSESTKNSGFTFTVETEAQFKQFLYAVGETNEKP